MQESSGTALQKGIAVAVLAATIFVVLCLRQVKLRKAPRFHLTISSYSVLLSAAFLFGVLYDDGFGWAFLPLMVAAAPFSFLIAAPLGRILDKLGVSNWTGPLLMDFVLLVLVCGGLNMLLLYILFKKISGSEKMPKIT